MPTPGIPSLESSRVPTTGPPRSASWLSSSTPGLHADRRGRIRLVLRCPAADSKLPWHGSSLVALLTVKVGHGGDRHTRVLRLTLAHMSFGVHRGQFTVTLRLGRRARALLRAHRDGLKVAVTISLPSISTHRVAALLKG